jgi:hypothetical protein
VSTKQIFPVLRSIAAALIAGTAMRCVGLEVNAPGGMPTGNTITAEQLWEKFDQTLPADIWVSPLESKKYEVISAQWMRRAFLPELKREMKELWTRRIPEEDTAGNCNGFALICRLMLSLSAMESHAHAPAAATVIVKQEKSFGGLPATREDHCVAFVLTDEGPWIIEVQSGTYTKLQDYPNRATITMVSVH